MELPRQLHEEIEALSEAGNELFDQELYDQAIEKWQHALDLVPKTDWEATLWLCALILETSVADERRARKSGRLWVWREMKESPDG